MSDVIQELGHLGNDRSVMRESRMQGQLACPVWRGLGRNDSQQWEDRAPLPPYITYIRLRGGWLYLVAVLDWFSRYVLSWELDQTLEMPFVVSAVQRALTVAKPRIWNSDQGSHFTSPQYLDLLQTAGVQISMDGRGRALDNIFTERLWRTVKYEEVYLHDYDSPREARHALARYFEFYCTERPHQALNYQTPAQVYFADKVCWNEALIRCGYVDSRGAPPAHIPTATTTTMCIHHSQKGKTHLTPGHFCVLTRSCWRIPVAD